MPPGDDIEDEGAPLFPGMFGRMTGAARRRGQRISGAGTDVISKFDRAITRFEKAVGRIAGGGPGSATGGYDPSGGATIMGRPVGAPTATPPTPAGGGAGGAGGWRARMANSFGGDAAAQVMALQQIGQLGQRFGGAISGYFDRQRPPMMALEGMASMGQNFGFGQRGQLMHSMNSAIFGGDVAGHVAIQNAALRTGPQGYSIMRSMGMLGSVNPLIDQSAVASSYRGMLTPNALRNMIPFGGAAVLNGGQMNGNMGDVLNRYIRAASGGHNAGQMTQRQADATFGLYGQGRATLTSYFGLDENMADLTQQYAAGSARAGRPIDLNNKRDVIKFLGNDFNAAMQKREGRGLAGDIAMHEGTREGQKNVADALGYLEQKAKGAASALGDIIPYGGLLTGTAGKLLGVVGELGSVMMGFGMLRGGGGGGIPGVGGGGMLANLGARLPGGMGLAGRAGIGIAGQVGGEILAHQGGTGPGGMRWLGKDAGTMTKWTTAGAAVGGPWGALGGAGIGAAHVIGRHLGIFGDPADDTEMDKILGDRYGGQWINMNQQFRKKLASMFRANPKLSLSSGWRSTQQQQHLYDEWKAGRHKVPSVAKPGHSNHEKGLAADIGPASEYGWIRGNATKYGLTAAAVKGEPWHVEPIGAKNMAATSSGSLPSSVSTPHADTTGSFTVKQGTLAYRISDILGATSIQRLGGGSGGGRGSATGGSSSGGPVDGTTGGGGGVSNGSLLDTLRAAGFSGEGLRTAYAIAMAESGGRAGAHNTNARTGDNSYGLFQINMLGRMGPARRKQYGLQSNDELLNSGTNARVAFQMSGGGSNWSPWSTYKSGAYKKYLNADIGDPAESGGGAAAAVVRGGNSVSVTLHMPLQVVQATEQEAQRLVNMIAEKLEKEERIKMLGSR